MAPKTAKKTAKTEKIAEVETKNDETAENVDEVEIDADEGCSFSKKDGTTCSVACVSGSKFCSTHIKSKQALNVGKPHCTATKKNGDKCGKPCCEDSDKFCKVHLTASEKRAGPVCKATIHSKDGSEKPCTRLAREGGDFCSTHTKCTHEDGKTKCKKSCHAKSLTLCLEHDTSVKQCKSHGCKSIAENKDGFCKLHHQKARGTVCQYPGCKKGKEKIITGEKAKAVKGHYCSDHLKLMKLPQCAAFRITPKSSEMTQCENHVSSKNNEYCDKCMTSFGINAKKIGKDEKEHHNKAYLRMMKFAKAVATVKDGESLDFKPTAGQRSLALNLLLKYMKEMYERAESKGEVPDTDVSDEDSEGKSENLAQSENEPSEDGDVEDDGEDASMESIVDGIMDGSYKKMTVKTSTREFTVSKNGDKIQIQEGGKKKTIDVKTAKNYLKDDEEIKGVEELED